METGRGFLGTYGEDWSISYKAGAAELTLILLMWRIG
jgi:hypothetical protein